MRFKKKTEIIFSFKNIILVKINQRHAKIILIEKKIYNNCNFRLNNAKTNSKDLQKKKLPLKTFGFPQFNTTFKLAFLQRLLDWNL